MNREITNEYDHKYTDEIICPYCGYEHHDSWEVTGGGDMNCDECGKEFYYCENITVDYCTEKKE